jgi:plasmid stability protein
MATIEIRNVPEDVCDILRTRAAAAGMTLEQYLRSELVRRAQLQLTDVSFSSADVIAADRESH